MFWQLAYNMNWIDKETLKLAVITETNPFGEITPAEYEIITNQPFVD